MNGPLWRISETTAGGSATKQVPESAMRRAMKVMEVILKAIAREIKRIQAMDILGVTPLTTRRMWAIFLGAGDQRSGRPTPGAPFIAASPL